MCTCKTKMCTSEGLFQLWNFSPLQRTLWSCVIAMLDHCMLLASCSNTLYGFGTDAGQSKKSAILRIFFLVCQGSVIMQTKTAERNSSKIVQASFIFCILYLLSLCENRRGQLKKSIMEVCCSFFSSWHFFLTSLLVCIAQTTNTAEEFLQR